MKHFKWAQLLLAAVLTAGLANCGLAGSSSPKTPPTPPTITAISLSPQNSAVTIGHNVQLQAMATLSDGSQSDVSSTASWASSNTALATVQGGLVKGTSPGVVEIQAASGAVNATTLLSVTSKAFSNASLSGRYAFTLTSNTAQGLKVEAGSISADGSGNVTGTEDVNAAGSVSTNVSVHGAYSVTRDGTRNSHAQ